MIKKVIINAAFLIAIRSLLSCNENACEYSVRENHPPIKFHGYVVRKFIDSFDRLTRKVVLNDSTRRSIKNQGAYDYIQPGDTIIKKEGTLKYIIKRVDSVSYFYPECINGEIRDKN